MLSRRSRQHQVEISGVETNGPAWGEGSYNQVFDLLDAVAKSVIQIYDLVEGEEAVKT